MINGIAKTLSSYAYASADEGLMHEALAEVLAKSDIAFLAEYVLSDRDRIDFYLPESQIGIECKIDGSLNEVVRQLLRYAEHAEILGMILLTSRRMHTQVPQRLKNKPVRVVSNRAF